MISNIFWCKSTLFCNYIYKFKVLNGLKSDGVNLTMEAKYDFEQRVRSFCLGKVYGKDMFYAVLDDKSIGVMDPETGTASILIPAASLVHAGKYGSVSVSGGKYLTIGESNGANETGIEVKTKDGALFLSEGTYFLVEDKCPICDAENHNK